MPARADRALGNHDHYSLDHHFRCDDSLFGSFMGAHRHRQGDGASDRCVTGLWPLRPIRRQLADEPALAASLSGQIQHFVQHRFQIRTAVPRDSRIQFAEQVRAVHNFLVPSPQLFVIEFPQQL